MMEIVKICAILSLTALVSLILKGQNNGFHHLIGVTGTVIAGIYAVNCLSSVLEYIEGISAVNSEIVEILIRALGISYLTDFASSVCRDTGETGLAIGVELCGKAEILIISLPLFSGLMELCTNIINQTNI